MVVLRSSWVSFAFTVALLTSCAGSPFAAHDEAPGHADGAPPMAADASVDASPDASIDANVDGECPSPCLGNAARDYNGRQGGSNGRWRYREDPRAADGTLHPELVLAAVGDLPGWVGSVPGSGIVSCTDLAGPSSSRCASLSNHLLVLPAPLGDGLADPVLSFEVAEDSVLELSGDLRRPDDGLPDGVRQRLTISRRSRHDVLFTEIITPSAVPHHFETEAEFLAGDQILVTLTPIEPGFVSSMGLRFFVSGGPAFPGDHCLLAANFDGEGEAEQHLEHCGGTPFVEAAPGESTEAVLSVSGELGSARRFRGGSLASLTLERAISRSGDFTLDMWFRRSHTGYHQLFYDFTCEPGHAGGMSIQMTSNRVFAAVATAWTSEGCTWNEVESDPLENPEGWHFYRFVHSAADGILRMCVDGQGQDSVVVGAANLSGPSSFHFGGLAGFLTDGTLDEIREYGRALPCSMAPRRPASLWTNHFSDFDRGASPEYYGTLHFADTSGDGAADVCSRDPDGGVGCALSDGARFGDETGWTSAFSGAGEWSQPAHFSTIRFPDLNDDGLADICGRDVGGVTCALSSGTSFGPATTWTSEFRDGTGFELPAYYTGLSFPDVNGDGKADVCARGGDNIKCALSTGTKFAAGVDWTPKFDDPHGWILPEYYRTLAFPDVDGDHRADVCAVGDPGRRLGVPEPGVYCAVSAGDSFIHFKRWNTALGGAGWDQHPGRYDTVRFPDVNGDGRADLCARSELGISCALSTGNAFTELGLWTTFFDESGAWGDADDDAYFDTLSFPDLDHDGQADVCGRGPGGVYCARSNGSSFVGLELWDGSFSDATFWNDSAAYYQTITFADVSGDSKPELCGRGVEGIYCTP
jgi:hypothetical protein